MHTTDLCTALAQASQSYVLINGLLVSEQEAKLSLFDLAILRGYGAFDFLRTYRKRPFHLREHLERLQFSCSHIGLQLPQSLEEIEEGVHQILQINDFPESSIKIIVTGGESEDQFTPSGKCTLSLFSRPLSPHPEAYYQEGIKMCTTALKRSLPMSKTLQYTPALVAMQRIQPPRPHEILYLNERNELLEGATSNFFAFKNGVLHTSASEEVLFGITREAILHLAANHFPISTAPLTLEELPSLDEAFLTGTSKEVMPVVNIDGVSIGDGRVGPNTLEIMRLYRAYVAQDRWPHLNILRHTNI